MNKYKLDELEEEVINLKVDIHNLAAKHNELVCALRAICNFLLTKI